MWICVCTCVHVYMHANWILLSFFKGENNPTRRLTNSKNWSSHYTKPLNPTAKGRTYIPVKQWDFDPDSPIPPNRSEIPDEAQKQDFTLGTQSWIKTDPDGEQMDEGTRRRSDHRDLTGELSQLHLLRSAVRADTSTLNASSLPGATLLSGCSRTARRR